MYGADKVARLVRQRRDAACAVGCAAPDPVTSFPPGIPIVTLRCAAPRCAALRVLFAVDSDGIYFGEHDRKGAGVLTMIVKK